MTCLSSLTFKVELCVEKQNDNPWAVAREVCRKLGYGENQKLQPLSDKFASR